MELLPPWAARELPVTAWAWDALVDAEATALVVDPYRLISLSWMRELVRLRRHLHREPEVGLQLPRTQDSVLAELDGLGLEVRTGGQCTSVTAVLRG